MGAKEGDIFDAPADARKDQMLVTKSSALIREQKSTPVAFHEVSERYAAALAACGRRLSRERAEDMRDLTSRVLDQFARCARMNLTSATSPSRASSSAAN